MSEEHPYKQQEQAYQQIRSDIIFLRHKPGERLAVKNLCDQLGFGRTPVRESLLRLQQEGLVQTVPQSGTYVSTISLEAAENGRYMREILEGNIAVECCARATPTDIDALDHTIALQKEALLKRDCGEFLVNDNLMHQTLYVIAGRERVWDWLNSANADLERYRRLHIQTQDLQWDAIIDEHHTIRNAIASRNPAEANFLISKHLHVMLDAREQVVAEFGEYFA